MQLPKLNFPEFDFRYSKSKADNLQIFDSVRKKFIDLTPEEWVRQHLINYLIHYKNVPPTLLSVEKQLILNNTKRRTDLVIYNSSGIPLLITECKAPNINLNQDVLNQAFGYNLKLKVPYIIITNGLSHICVHSNNQTNTILKEIPDFFSLQE